MKCAILQNKHRNLAGLMIASVFALAACGGGGGGDHGGLPAVVFTKRVEVVGGGGLFGNLFSSAAGNRYMFLLTAADIKGSGNVRSLRFRYGAALAGAVNCPNTTIKMGATTVATLSPTYDSNVNQGAGSFTTVLNNAAVSIPAGSAGSYFNIDLATLFDYNGKDNLVVEVTRTSACTGDMVVQIAAVAYNGSVFASGAGTSTIATGTASLFSAHMELGFTAGDNKIDFGGASSNFFPFANTTGSAGRRTQHLYLASEINGSGPVTGIAFQSFETTLAGTYTYTLRLGHSTLSALGTTFASNYSGSPTTVANAVANFTIPAGVPAGEWIWVPIPDGVFTYNGTDNLIVDVSVPTGSVNNTLRFATLASRRVYNNMDAAATTGTAVDNSAYHVALRLGGGPMAVITPGGMGGIDLSPFYEINGKRQLLYRAAELGTKGTISKLACRASAGGPAETGFNYTVVLSHSTASTLGATYATNLTSPVTVFSGTLNIPATLVGDWLEIPFATPFSYNGIDNLVVQVSGTGGTAGGAGCAADTSNAVRYAGRRVFSGLSTDTVGGVTDFLLDMRFTLN